MRSTERWSFKLQQNSSGKYCVLHLRPEFIELILELFRERNRPLHLIPISLRLYSLGALLLQ